MTIPLGRWIVALVLLWLWADPTFGFAGWALVGAVALLTWPMTGGRHGGG